jgi:hypothetical protein
MTNNSDVARRLSIAVALVVLFLGVITLALTAQNEGCLPWQERVGYGDGPFGESQDYSRCR